jgi:hypothetical protein
MKITPDHLARGAFIYVRQSTVDQLATIMRADGVNMALPTVLVLSAGRM